MSSAPVTRRTQVFRGLQVLRAIAAVMVVFTHSGFYASERLIHGFQYWQEGAAGVDIFFVLSGFVMIHSSRSLFGVVGSWKIFAERRIVRIVPLYWLATTIKLAFLLAGSAAVLHAHLDLWKTVCAYLFLPTRNADHELRPLLGVGWTLNFEMFFYLLFTICLALRANVYWILATIFTALAVASYFISPNGPSYTFYMNPVVLDFLYGMLIAAIFKFREAKIHPALLVVLFVAASATLVSPMPPSMDLLRGLSAALILWTTIQLEPWLSRIPKAALFLGDASYAIYLFHPMIAPLGPTVLMRLHLPIAALSILFSVALGIGAGCLIHVFVEMPLTKFFRSHVRYGGRKIIHLPTTTAVPE